MKAPTLEELDKEEHEHEFPDPEIDKYPIHWPESLDKGYTGNVCPYCGRCHGDWHTVVTHEREVGGVFEVSPEEGLVPLYCLDCWTDRNAEAQGQTQGRLNEWV